MVQVSKSSRDVFTVMVGEALARGLAFIGSLLIVKMATAEEMGLFSFFFSAMSILFPFAELGLNVAMVRFISAVETTGEERASLLRTALVLRGILLTVLTLVILLASSFIAGKFFGNPEFATPLRLASLATLGLSLHSLATAYFQADQRFLRMVMLRAGEGVLRFLLIVALLFTAGLNIKVIMLIFAVAPMTICLIGLRPFLREIRNGTFSRELALRFLGYSKWIVVSTVAGSIASQVDVMLLARMVSTEELGEYGAALRLVIPVQVIGNAVITVLFPRFSRERSTEGLRILHMRFLRIAIPISLILAVACLVFAPLLVNLFPQYGDFGRILQILGTTFSLAVALNLGGMVMLSLDKPNIVAYVNLLQLALGIGINTLLISWFGATGAALGAFLVWTGGGLTLTILALRRLRPARA